MKRSVVRFEYRESNSWLRTPFTLVVLSCGHETVVGKSQHVQAAEIPAEAECTLCGDISAHETQLREWIGSGRVAYTRAGDRLLRGSVLIYGREPSSPTGVLLLGAVPDVPELAHLLRGPMAPLSPTEGRGRAA